jgi:radical SAM protein with 4Fe4S-binding SPASM domain
MIEVLRQGGYFPRSCVWELTLRCNMSCKHCGSAAGRPRGDELSLSECKRVAAELVALGCRRVTLGGGEPTLNPGWCELGGRLVELGARVNLITNGWTWSREDARRARAAGLANVAFSLDGLEPEHDAFRREGSFARVVGGIRASLEEGLPVAVNTTIHARNARQLRELRRLLAGLGVFSWQLQLATPSGNLREHRELVLADEDLLWLVPLVAEMKGEPGAGPPICPGDDIGYYGRFERALRDHGDEIPFWIGCRAGCKVIGIESDGGVKGCLSLPSRVQGEDRFLEGNVRGASLAEIWRRPGAFAYNREFREEQLGGFCAVCRFRTFCRGGCTWTAYSQTRNRFDNPTCFYRQAVAAGRLDLLDEEPLPEERAYFERPLER